MQTYRRIVNGLKGIGFPTGVPVIIHTNPAALNQVRGKGETLLGALFSFSEKVITPAFTPSTLVIPQDGLENNGIRYGSGADTNAFASIFSDSLHPDASTSPLASTILKLPDGKRSNHPVLSFAGVNLDSVLLTQTLLEPLGPLRALSELNGWVLLFGTDLSNNSVIHWAEKEAGRKLFTRWAMTKTGIAECPSMPGCSRGFAKINPMVEAIEHKIELGSIPLRAFPIKVFSDFVKNLIQEKPDSLLCDEPDCLCCNDVRKGLDA